MKNLDSTNTHITEAPPATGLFGELSTEEEVWPGFIEILEPDTVNHTLYERGRMLVYTSPVDEERWFTYTQDDAGKGVKKFLAIGDGSILVLRANTSSASQTTWQNCNRNASNAATNHASFVASLAAHTYTDWLVSSGIGDSTFVDQWNAASSSERFKLMQGTYNQTDGSTSMSHVGYVLYRTSSSQYWLLFSASGSGGEIAYTNIGVDPNTSQDNSSTKGALKFVASTGTFTLSQVQAFPAHTILKHAIGTWP